jgi:hypothetical protein
MARIERAGLGALSSELVRQLGRRGGSPSSLDRGPSERDVYVDGDVSLGEMTSLRCAVVLVVAALAESACGGGHPATSTGVTSSTTPVGKSLQATVSAKTVSSSRLILGGRVRCTAVVTTPVQVGHVLDVIFRIRNVSQHPAKVQLAHDNLWVVVRRADGTTYDTRLAARATGSLGGPCIQPTTIRPGGTETRHYSYLRVRWSGPLQVTPGCRAPLDSRRRDGCRTSDEHQRGGRRGGGCLRESP